jgi:hypothetical protein
VPEPQELWAFSPTGFYAHTTDSGQSWSSGTIYHDVSVNAAVFTPGGEWGWTVGTGDQIMRYHDLPDAVPKPHTPLPSSLTLTTYPNPFNAVTTLAWELPNTVHTVINLYDVTGRLVRTIADGTMAAGHHVQSINANDLPSGLYFVRLQAAAHSLTQKLLLVR